MGANSFIGTPEMQKMVRSQVIFSYTLKLFPQLNLNKLPSRRCMHRPQFSHVSFGLNFALVSIRSRLYGWRFLLIILYFDVLRCFAWFHTREE